MSEYYCEYFFITEKKNQIEETPCLSYIKDCLINAIDDINENNSDRAKRSIFHALDELNIEDEEN